MPRLKGYTIMLRGKFNLEGLFDFLFDGGFMQPFDGGGIHIGPPHGKK
jgi:hypothetical protein